MGVINPRSIGYYLKAVASHAYQAGTAGAVTGAAIDRAGVTQTGSGDNAGMAASMKVVAIIAATTGAPSAQSLTLTAQQCATSGGQYTAYTDPSQTNTAVYSAATAGILEWNLDLEGALEFIEIVATAAFTGGTGPAMPYTICAILGGFPKSPVE
jgi:hypothetical protein